MAEIQGPGRLATPADVGIRGPLGLMATEHGRRFPFIPGTGRTAGGPRQGDGIHGARM